MNPQNTPDSLLAGLWEAYGSSTNVGVRHIATGKKVCGVTLGPQDSDIADLIAAAPAMRDLLAKLVAAHASASDCVAFSEACDEFISDVRALAVLGGAA